MKPKTKSELMAEWASQSGQLKKKREVKAVRKAMDDARAVMQDGLARYVKKKTKARSKGKGVELNPDYFRDGVGYLETADAERDAPTLFDLLENGA